MKRHEEEMDHVWKTFRPDAAAKRSSLFGKKQIDLPIPLSEWTTGGNPPVSSVTV